MYPTNQYMDPYYSHYRSHTPYPYYPPPGWEAGHPRVMDSPYYRPPSFGPWPYNSGIHHPHPPEFHCCCNHSYQPGYYGFRPPFPQELPPAHLYYHGPFPHPPNEYPSSFAHPLPYPVEQTPNDYDYNKFKSHCCGCPNHVCHGGEKNNLKIEEEKPGGKPEMEPKDADSSSIIRHPNNQYPVIWLPWGNTEDKENGKRYELPQQFLNGWAPVSGKRAEDAKQQRQGNQREKQYQWPIVWMPAGYDEPEQKTKEVKEKDENPKIPEETPPSPKIKIIPLSWFEDQKPAAKSGSHDHSDRSAVESHPTTTENRDGAAMEVHNKTTPVVPRRVNHERKPARENYKTIPVLPEKVIDEKQLCSCRDIPVTIQKENDGKNPAVAEKKEEKKTCNAIEKKSGTCRDIPVTTQKDNVEKKAAVTEKKEDKKTSNAKNGKGNHSESPTAKHSKLSPVCLRVDPLPRKKSGNGSSRSPSPPKKDADKAKRDVNGTQSQNLEPKQPDTKEHTNVSEMKEKLPEEPKKGTGFSNETVLADSTKHLQEEEAPTSNEHQKVHASGANDQAQENARADAEGDHTQVNGGAETLKGGDKYTDRNTETFRAKLSEADAAVRIQSAYRRYDVRRWQPLDKLREIRGVHEQMHGVRKQLQSLEASSKKPTEKEHMAIGEAIMNLLLKLDTIQGLHPCVREARKSVARELICLQEKLDSLCKQPSGRFDNSNEDERLDRAESVVHNAAPALTAEASNKEEKAVRLSEANETSPVNSLEPGDSVPSEVPTEVPTEAEQGADPSELKNQNENSCTSTLEVPPDEGKGAEQVEFHGASRQMEESNSGALEANEEEKKVAVVNEVQNTPPMDSMGPSHDAAPTVDSNEQEKCMASTGQSLQPEGSSTGVSPAIAGDITTTTNTEPLDNNGLAADNVVSVDDQPREAVDTERLKLGHDFSPAEETPDVTEDLLVSLKNAEPHDDDPNTAADSVTSNVDKQPEEARNMNMQEQAAGTTVDLTKDKEPEGISEASMGPNAEVTLEGPQISLKDAERHQHDPTTVVTCNIDEQLEEARSMNMQPDVTSEASMGPMSEDTAAFEDSALAALLEPVSESDSVSEQILEELNDAKQSEIFGKDDVQHVVDQKNEVQELTREEFDDQENHSVAEGAGSRTEESSAGYERPAVTVSLKSQIAEAEPNTDERTETLMEAPTGIMGANSVEEVDGHASQTKECNGTLDDSTVCATGVAWAEVEPDNQKEDVSVQTESKATAEALPTVVTPDSVKDSDEKKLAEENQKLKELLLQLLASGNDQTELITGLNEKVKLLERKLARKKKPKVRVHRPARHATAKVH